MVRVGVDGVLPSPGLGIGGLDASGPVAGVSLRAGHPAN